MRRRGVPVVVPLLLMILLSTPPTIRGLLAQEPPPPPPGAPGGAAAPAPAAPPTDQASTAPQADAPPGVEVMVLSLDDCLKQSLENNLDIAVRRYDPLRSEAQVTLSQSAFDSTLTGGANRARSVQRGITPNFGVLSSRDTQNNFNLGFNDPLISGGNYRFDLLANDDRNRNGFSPTPALGWKTSWQFTLNQPLLRNLGASANGWLIVTARNTLGQSESRFRQTVMETLAAAEKAYWDLNFALMDLKTKRVSLKLAQDFLDENRIKVRVGTLAPIEITQAEAGVADREEAVIIAENAVRTAEDALRRILNVPKDSPLWSRAIQPSDAPPLVEAAPDLEGAVATAEAHRPDLEQARLDVKNRETELQFRRNQRRWALDFQGIYGVSGFSSTQVATDPSTGQPILDPLTGDEIVLQNGSYHASIEDLEHRNQRDWQVGLNLAIPLRNRQAISNYTNAEFGVTQTRYTLAGLEQAARVEVRNAVRAVQTNLKRVRSAQVNVRLQHEKLAAEQKKYENGMSTSFQVLSFQNDLTTAESRENQAIVDYNKSLVELERVKGTLLEAKKVAVPGVDGTAPPAAWSFPSREGARDADLAFRSAQEDPQADGRITLPSRFVWVGRRLIAADPATGSEGATAAGAGSSSAAIAAAAGSGGR
jgi:outer membrane protein